MAWVRACKASELPPGEVTEIVLGDELYAVCNVRGELRAIGGVCPHSGGPLGQGALHGEMIVCPWHMWPFDSATGECQFNLELRVPRFPARVEEGDVLLDLP